MLNLPFIIEFLTQPPQTALMSIYPDWHMTHSEWCVLLRSIPKIGWHSLATLFRHDDSIEYHATFMSAGRYRQVRGPARTGRPRLHWAESTMTEALHRIEHLQSDAAPSHSDLRHSFFQLPTLHQIKTSHTSSSLIGMENLSLYRSIALQRKNWAKLVHKPPRRTPS